MLVVNREHDPRGPTPNTRGLARRLAHSTVIVHPDTGRGGIFQFHADFVHSAGVFIAQ